MVSAPTPTTAADAPAGTAAGRDPIRIPAEDAPARLHLRAGGVSLLLDLADGRLPGVVHWGADLGDLSAEDAALLTRGQVPNRTFNDQDMPQRLDLLGSQHEGYQGRPGLDGSRRDGSGWTPRFLLTGLEVRGVGRDAAEPDAAAAESGGDAAEPGGLLATGPAAVVFHAADEREGLRVSLAVELLASGLVRARATLTNAGPGEYEVRELGVLLPVPAQAGELFDLAGHWGKERVPQRRPFGVGTHLREGRKGRTGADAALLLTAGAPGFGFGEGEVWGLHTAFSGNHRTWAERLYSGHRVLGGSELLLPGEVVLGEGESYTGAWAYAAWGIGQDEQARRIHRWLRARPGHPRRERPVTLNVWEAVYFDHDLARLTDLADRAADLGIERYVLDDGWFGARRDDTAGLGDWVVSPDAWPEGLAPLVDHVSALGMEFGLWVEPEMVNPDSDVARAHPEWTMAPAGRLPNESRHQQVLNLGIPEAYAHVRDQLVAILEEHPGIAYLKWDHNRDLLEAGTAPTGRPGVHEQTLAAYRLMDELRERFPALEIESCSSGGARVDLEVLQRTDRVWTSDCIDPLERQQMHRWTQQLLPAELMGAHVASGVSHTTGRIHTLHFRAATAVWGHLGVEWDLARATEAELAELGEWIALHRRHRELLHGGELVRMDAFDPTVSVHGVVAADRGEALFGVTSLGSSDVDPIGRFRLRGLDPERRYAVRDVTPGPVPDGYRPAPWWPVDGPVEIPGRLLMDPGLHLPGQFPESSRLLHLTALEG